MKKALLCLAQVCLVLPVVFTVAQAQTCTFTELRLDSQAAVNNFNPTCKNIKGDITITGGDITDLRPLENIEIIDGTLKIQNNPALVSLRGLEKLTSAKHLMIYTNNLLTDLTGLGGLQSVGSLIHIRFNQKLSSLNGLNNLTEASTLFIGENDALASMAGLNNLEYVSTSLSINSNKNLASLNGLSKLTNVKAINIGGNDLLPDLTGLESLTSVSYQMHISYNKGLVSLKGLDNLNMLSEAYIAENDILPDLSGLENVRGVNWLVVGENKKLTSLTGLDNLMSATNLIIRNNPLLTDLSGLGSLTSVGWMQVIGNAALTSLAGLGNDTNSQGGSSNARVSAVSLDRLAITDNPNLTSCAIFSVCDFIKANTATISGNGTGCQDQAALTAACASASLPVTLTHFTGTTENKATLLQWRTTEEKNSLSFDIEYSSDTKIWQKLGELPAKGESSRPVDYRWIHTAAATGLNYYRLKMVDRDGRFEYSRIISVEFEKLDNAPVLVYPNPVSERVFVESADRIARLQILDMHGKTVFETHQVSQSGLSLKKVPAGFYQIYITTQSGATQARKIMVP